MRLREQAAALAGVMKPTPTRAARIVAAESDSPKAQSPLVRADPLPVRKITDQAVAQINVAAHVANAEMEALGTDLDRLLEEQINTEAGRITPAEDEQKFEQDCFDQLQAEFDKLDTDD